MLIRASVRACSETDLNGGQDSVRAVHISFVATGIVQADWLRTIKHQFEEEDSRGAQTCPKRRVVSMI